MDNKTKNEDTVQKKNSIDILFIEVANLLYTSLNYIETITEINKIRARFVRILTSDVLSQKDAICDDEEAVVCAVDVKQNTEFKIPFVGVVDFKDFSLFSMSIILGFVDGFNPCAMWVLLTFLLIFCVFWLHKKAGFFMLDKLILNLQKVCFVILLELCIMIAEHLCARA